MEENQNAVETPKNHQPTHNLKSKLPILMAVIISGIIFGSVGFVAGLRVLPPTPQPTISNGPTITTVIPTATSEPLPTSIPITSSPNSAEEIITCNKTECLYNEHGYSFEYPQNWIVSHSEYANSVVIGNPTGTIGITISEGQYPYGFSGGSPPITKKEIVVNVNGKDYNATEIITDNKSVYVDIGLKDTKDHHIIFGNDYPAQASDGTVAEYNNGKSTIFKILSSLKFTN